MNVKYISEGSAAIARSMERIIQKLSAEAGIHFVSVEPFPAFDGICDYYQVFVGAKRNPNFDSSTIETVVSQALHNEYPLGTVGFEIHIQFGVQGMCVK